MYFLANQQRPKLQDIIEFEKKYRDQVALRHGTITPPNFDSSIKKPINELYVKPCFVRNPKKKGEGPQSFKMKDFLSNIHRVVILGMPGGGKSTFALKLCSDLATNYSERLVAGRQITPILVILRDFGAEKKTHRCSILQFIESNSRGHFRTQTGRSPSEKQEKRAAGDI